MNTEISNRIATVSFLCAVLVVTLHVPAAPKWVSRSLSINRVSVLMFFVISGYLFAKGMGEDGWYAKKLSKRFKSLFVPYAFWNTAYWLSMVLLGVAAGLVGTGFGGLANVEGMMSAKWDLLGFDPFCFPSLGFLWYVRALLVFCLASPLYKVLCRSKWGGVAIIVPYAALVAYSVHTMSAPEYGGDWVLRFNVKGWLTGSCFFGSGIWLRFHAHKLVEERMPFCVAFAVLSVGWLCLAWKNPVSTYIGIPLGVAGLWHTMRGVSLPGWMSGCAFPIYVMHAFFSLVCSAAKSVFPQQCLETWKLPVWMATFAVMLGGPIIAAWLLRRFAQRCATVVFGGR